MALFSDLKRIFFGAKSVAKHQAGKAADAAEDIGRDLGDAAEDLARTTRTAARDLAEKAPEYVAKGKDALEDLTDKIWRETPSEPSRKPAASEDPNAILRDLNQRVQQESTDLEDFEGFDLGTPKKSGAAERPPIDFEDLTVSEKPDAPGKKGLIDWESEFMQNAKKTAGDVASKADELATPGLDAAARAGHAAKEKTGEILTKVGEEVLDKGDKILNRAAEVGADAKEKWDSFVDHASTEAEKMRMEDAIEKARIAGEVAEARARSFDKKEGERDTSESLLDSTDSFFDRADRFAKGDYSNEGGKDMRILPNPDTVKKPSKGGSITGFSDDDGDGDPLIDDAIIEED